MNLINLVVSKFQYACERAVVWALRRCLMNYSFQMSKNLTLLDVIVSSNHQAAVQVSFALLEAIQKLDGRLKAIEEAKLEVK